MDKLKNHLGPDVSRYFELQDVLLAKSSTFPYNVNLLCLENITEQGIVEAIKPLGWIQPGDVDGCSTNCRINAFNNYIHQNKYGYSPYELELSHLIRKNLLSREEALGKLYDQPIDQIEEIKRILNLNA